MFTSQVPFRTCSSLANVLRIFRNLLLGLNRFALSVGILIGIVIACFLYGTPQVHEGSSNLNPNFQPIKTTNQENHPSRQYYEEASDQNVDKSPVPFTNNVSNEVVDDRLAVMLQNRISITCLVLTTAPRHNSYAATVMKTWGKRCTNLIFVSTKSNETIGAIHFDGMKSEQFKWGMVRSGLRYALDKFPSSQWFLKSDDTSYFVMENLRLMLATFDPMKLAYYGFRLKPRVAHGYMSGSPGYVFSRQTLVKLVNEGLFNGTVCQKSNQGPDDVPMGKCAEKLGIEASDTRDTSQRYRFLMFHPEKHILPDALPKTHSFWNDTYYPPKQGMDCCSDNAVAFGQLNANKLQTLEYLIYHLRPYGISPHSALIV